MTPTRVGVESEFEKSTFSDTTSPEPEDAPPTTMTTNHTRRRVLRTGAAGLAATIGIGTLGTAAANPGTGDENGNDRSFGRVWADGKLFRTNVVTTLDEEPDPGDAIYFVNDGTADSLPPNGSLVNDGASPFVSESKPGDRDYNGGQWVHYSAAFPQGTRLDDALTSVEDVLNSDATITKGAPAIPGAPPDFFICPLTGQA